MVKPDFRICEWQWPGDLAQLLIAASYSYHVQTNLNEIIMFKPDFRICQLQWVSDLAPLYKSCKYAH